MKGATDFRSMQCAGLTLAGFKPTLRLVDYIDAALTAHDAAIAVALLERAEGVTYLHGRFLFLSRRADCALGYVTDARGAKEFMVDDTGIEPVTPSMSTKCSTAELIIHIRHVLPAPYNETGRGRTASGLGAIKGVVMGIKAFW